MLLGYQQELTEFCNDIRKVFALMTVQGEQITPLSFKDAVKRLKDGKEGVSEASLTFN